MPNVTDKVRKVVGDYAHPGKHEGGTALDPAIMEWSLNGDNGEDYVVHWADDGTFAMLYQGITPRELRGCALDEYGFRDAITYRLTMIRACVVIGNSQGFISVEYFDNDDDANEYYCAATPDWDYDGQPS